MTPGYFVRTVSTYMPLGPTRDENIFVSDPRLQRSKGSNTTVIIRATRYESPGTAFDTQDYCSMQEFKITSENTTFFHLLQKGKTIVVALPLALHVSPHHAAAVTKFG